MLPPLLRGWAPADPLPDGLDRAELVRAGRELRASIEPADIKARAVVLKGLLDMARAFNIPVPDAKAASDAYLDGLASLPLDLLELAVARVRASWTWGMRLPLPGEVKAMVADELSRRQRDLFRARLALSRLPENEPRERGAVDQAVADEWFAKMRASLRRVPA